MKNFIYKTVATGFGSGYFPIAPGTVGAALGCLILYFLHFYTIYIPDFPYQITLILLILFFSITGAFATHQLEKEWGEDPSKVVIDEIIGVWISLLFIPINLPNLVIGFVLFRLFDIFKPLGIRRLEVIPNGWGVILDDVAAGIYANIALQIILWFKFF